MHTPGMRIIHSAATLDLFATAGPRVVEVEDVKAVSIEFIAIMNGGSLIVGKSVKLETLKQNFPQVRLARRRLGAGHGQQAQCVADGLRYGPGVAGTGDLEVGNASAG